MDKCCRALNVVTEFCDKGKIGFLTGDISLDLIEHLLKHISYIETSPYESNNEIYSKLEEFITSGDFALPKFGIPNSEFENP